MTHSILILGASYGSLVATKLLMAGHRVTLVCTRSTADLINREGTRVRFPVKGHAEPVEVASRGLPGTLRALTPDEVDPHGWYDLVVLGMQDAQYGAPGVRELVGRIARSRKPCLAISNMPPLPYLRRIDGIDAATLEDAFADPSLWEEFVPGLITLASPDPQAYRPADQGKNVLQVGLPTNFKAAPFEKAAHTELLRELQADIEAARYEHAGQSIEIPVKLKVHDSLFVPLAKWPMLLTGNYRCIRGNEMCAIKDAVHRDVERSRAIYASVAEICRRLGASAEDLVPFEKYAEAAASLGRPSSAARALFGGAKQIERVDQLVATLAEQLGLGSSELRGIVAQVDARLEANREEREAVAA